MTLFKPNLRVNELKVFYGGNPAFSEKFHSGLNIIRGQNSSGKSTIMDFLFYGLGGDLLESQWRETAVNCDSVMLEVDLNGSTVTLMREVAPASRRPMKIFYGNIDDASNNAVDGWETYSFSRSTKESFSQVIFRFLGLPQVEYGESNARLTVNQLLRLLYSDQMSSVEKIFRPQSFDLAITRQAVGDLLYGAYSDGYYKARLRKKDALEELKVVKSHVSFLIKTHSRDGEPLTEEWLAATESRLQTDLNELNEKIDALESEIFDAEYDDRLSLNDQKAAYERVVGLQETIGAYEEKLTAEELAQNDADEYIASLERKLGELQQSSVVVEELGGLSFKFCPSCLAPVEQEEVYGGCTLCKCAHDTEQAQSRVLKLINEYARQKERAISIQAKRKFEIIRLNSLVRETTELWEQASRHYTVSLRNPTSEMRTKLRKLNRDAGYAYRELEELAHKKAVIAEIAAQTLERNKLQKEIAKLDIAIANGLASQENRVTAARNSIENHVLDFLKRDLSRQSTFSLARQVGFEFDSDRLSVNDESYFSASSMVYLRNSFFASFLFAAANDPKFFHPRFLMMDTIEDKGLEPERSQNFQRILFEKSKLAKSEHQIIIATSMIAEELNIPEITVGEEYTHRKRTLSLSSV